MKVTKNCIIDSFFPPIYSFVEVIVLLQIGEDNDVYDVVDEDKYSEIVRQRQDDDWIVDDGMFSWGWGLVCILYIERYMAHRDGMAI